MMMRSLLFLPGNNPGMLINGDLLGSDSIIIDLEDAVSPDDKDAVRTSLAAMISSAPNGATFLDVTADPRMKPGDCILECERGVVDASLETQLKAIEHALLGKIRES